VSERRVAQKKHTPVKTLKKTDTKKLDEKPDPDKLLEVFNNDLGLLAFFKEWSINGHNQTKAYMKVYPDVSYDSARTLGGKEFAKVDMKIIMREFGLDEILYFNQLFEGVQASKWNDFTGEREPDHKTRLPYHDKLGKGLGIEKETNTGNVQTVYVLNKLDEQKKAYNLNE